ncbi:alpha-glycosidase [Bacillus kexueae]|uniref:alpha-glycosidase n=1 Tax=Aeribacillus kexueae TaxID=2078952 RepID=UPI001FAF9812|nr:alpha-glycosidase [Bacillus kexueae]
MLREAVYHRSQLPYIYMYQNDTLHIRLRTKKNDVQHVRLFYGDPFLWEGAQWVHEEKEMSYSGTDESFDYWLIELKTRWNRLRYGFIIQTEQETLYYTEKGFSDEKPSDIGPLFCYPYLHFNEDHLPPTWAKKAVWYQIFPDRFHNGSTENDPEPLSLWGEEPDFHSFFGGDLKGITAKIPYLAELGISGIYLTPIFHSNSNHKYDIIDYFQLDPHFGTKEELKELVTKCHNHDIKVMLDAVFNHCSINFPPFQDVLKNGEHSRYKDWFYIHHFPIQTEPKPNYETFSYEKNMPKMNTSNHEVISYFMDVVTYWTKEFDIDGWRLDVANEVPHAFWRTFRQTVKEIKQDVFIVGEVWHDAIRWLDGEQFDTVMNYPLLEAMRSYFLYETTSTSAFIAALERIRHAYPQTAVDVSFNLIGSHDTDRVWTVANHREELIRLLFAFFLTYPGAPCLYYGDEIRLTGGPDPNCRKCMPWEMHNEDFFQFVKRLIHLRNKLSLNDGTLRFHRIQNNSDVIVMTNTKDENRLIALFNKSDREQTITLPFPLRNRTLEDLWTNEEFAANAEELSVLLPPYSFQLLLEVGVVLN